MAATVVGQRILEALHVDLMAAALLGQCLPNALCDSLIGQSFCTRRGSSRETLLLSKRCSLRAFLLVSQTCECSLMFVAPQSLTGNPDVEAAAAKPQEDGLGSRQFSSFLGDEIVEAALTKSSSHQSGASGVLVEELLAASSLLAGENQLEPGTRLDEGMMLVERRVAQPHVVHGTLPGMVCGQFRTRVQRAIWLLPLRGKLEVFMLATNNPRRPVGVAHEFPDAGFPIPHPFAVRRASGRLQPFGCNAWEVRETREPEVVRCRGRGQMGRR
jgi:hypothetical protein